LKTYTADLHIHTCLSPCADVEMSPRRIAEEARRQRLEILGVCDHNSAENAAAEAEAAGRFGIRVLPGMEITSREEVHILALFEELEAALSMQAEVYAHLAGDNDEAVFGPQVIADAEDGVVGFCPKLLINAASLSLEGVVDHVRSRNGLAIAAHVDRESFGLLGQLGFIPERLTLDALEISPHLSMAEARERYGSAHPLIRSSDAHALRDIGRASTSFALETPEIEEIRMALGGIGGRRILS
jgi:3',5'-nucleoside bisphosphate phosphatase